MPVPPHSRFIFWEKAPAMEGLIPPEPVSPALTAVISPFPLLSSSPGLIRGAGWGTERGCPLLAAAKGAQPWSTAGWAGGSSGGAQGEQGSSTASSLIC